jgi:hypothetical protein
VPLGEAVKRLVLSLGPSEACDAPGGQKIREIMASAETLVFDSDPFLP